MEAGSVTRVIDGDTIEAFVNGQTVTIRYIGIDTPETVQPGEEVQDFGPEAAEKNRQLVEGKNVILVKDVSEKDSIWQAAAICVGGGPVRAVRELRAGQAGVHDGFNLPAGCGVRGDFPGGGARAQEESAGLWEAVEVMQPPPGSCDPSYPTLCIPPEARGLNCEEFRSRISRCCRRTRRGSIGMAMGWVARGERAIREFQGTGMKFINRKTLIAGWLSLLGIFSICNACLWCPLFGLVTRDFIIAINSLTPSDNIYPNEHTSTNIDYYAYCQPNTYKHLYNDAEAI